MKHEKFVTNYLDNPNNRLTVEHGVSYMEWCETKLGILPSDIEIAAHVLHEQYQPGSIRQREAGRFMSCLLGELAERSERL